MKISRRSFLKGTLAGAILLLHRPASALIPESSPLPDAALSLVNIHTGENLSVNWRDSTGNYFPGPLERINHFFRCHFTQQIHPMDIRVIEFLNFVQKSAGGNHKVEIISGYRSPEYNELLIREGRGAAKHSLHLQGKAIDFRIPEVGLDRLRDVAMRLKLGGVGYYPKSGFIHIDSGEPRSW